MTMRVGLFAPAVPPSQRGNAVSVARIMGAMKVLGVDMTARTTAELPEALAAGLEQRIDVLHLMHLSRTYDVIGDACRAFSRPYVMTQTGTDLGGDAPTGKAYEAFLGGARSIACNHAVARATL